jgi:hypothetical protein
MDCFFYKKPYPLYHIIYTDYKTLLIKVCQDCGYLETCHGPNKYDRWRHLIIHPDLTF